MADILTPSPIENMTIAILPQDNGQILCELSSPAGEPILSYGQTPEHAIACVLEQLADQYRQIAQAQQNPDWHTVEESESGEPIEKQYHVMLHYESSITASCKFEAMHDTLMGNTVVENAKITVIEISSDLPIAPLRRSWNCVSNALICNILRSHHGTARS
jgi:phosphoribosylformylglycinamidine (FGAM) synthase PurS component